MGKEVKLSLSHITWYFMLGMYKTITGANKCI